MKTAALRRDFAHAFSPVAAKRLPNREFSRRASANLYLQNRDLHFGSEGGLGLDDRQKPTSVLWDTKVGESSHITYQPIPVDKTRARTVTVPNVGAFAGLSFRIENTKVSAGYRADLFFHAMDGGIDTGLRENVGFYGPFASVSVGIGG